MGLVDRKRGGAGASGPLGWCDHCGSSGKLACLVESPDGLPGAMASAVRRQGAAVPYSPRLVGMRCFDRCGNGLDRRPPATPRIARMPAAKRCARARACRDPSRAGARAANFTTSRAVGRLNKPAPSTWLLPACRSEAGRDDDASLPQLCRLSLSRRGHQPRRPALFSLPLSLRIVEEMLAMRGIIVSHETMRQWARKFGQDFANRIRRRLPTAGDKWHLDGVSRTHF
jgi:putative transposase